MMAATSNDSFVVTLSYNVSLLFAYVIAAALVVTAFCMHREPAVVVVLTRSPEEGFVSVLVCDDD
jgi:hypothetical protein